MAGLLDLYGSDTFTDDQKAALQQRGLLGFLAGMQKSGALDYTAPFLSGKVPGGFAAALAGGAGGMGEAQDSAALNAMRGQLLGLQGQQIKGNLGLLSSEGDLMRAIAQRNAAGQGGAPSTAGPSTQGPSTAGPGGASAPTGDLLPTLVKQSESGGDYNIGFGGTDLSNAPKREDGFPIWEGKQGPAGISHAAGAYQFQPATWAEYAGPLGIKDFSPASQDKVFQAAVADKGLQPWMANPKIAALARTGQFVGSGSSMPPQGGILPQMPGNAPAQPAGSPFAQMTQGQPPMPSPQPQPSVAAPPGMSFGGGINMTPAEAQQLSIYQAMRGANTPEFINKTAGLPLVGPTAAATAEAENASKYKYAGPIAGAEAAAKVPYTWQSLHPGEVGGYGGNMTAFNPKSPEFHPNAGRDIYNREVPGIVTYGQTGGTVTPTQGGMVPGGAIPGAAPPGAPSTPAGSAPGEMLTPGAIKQNQAQGEANVKRSEALYDGIQSQSTQFQRDMNPYLQLSRSILNTPGMYSGAGGEWSLDFNRVKSAIGDTNAAMMQEALGKVTAQSVLSQINNQRAQMQESGGASSRIFSQQVGLVEKAAPAMTTTVAGNRFLVNVATRMGELSNTVAEMAREYKSQHGILDTGFDKQLSDYMKANPVFTKQELEHPQVLGAPNVPAGIRSQDQLQTWATSMGIKRGDPIRLEDGSVRAVP